MTPPPADHLLRQLDPSHSLSTRPPPVSHHALSKQSTPQQQIARQPTHGLRCRRPTLDNGVLLARLDPFFKLWNLLANGGTENHHNNSILHNSSRGGSSVIMHRDGIRLRRSRSNLPTRLSELHRSRSSRHSIRSIV